MIVDDPDNWRLVGFRKSTRRYKKYDAVLSNLNDFSIMYVPFGDRRYHQYFDNALGLYSHMDHKDPVRRSGYRSRHRKDARNKFSSGYFAMKYLW